MSNQTRVRELYMSGLTLDEAARQAGYSNASALQVIRDGHGKGSDQRLIYQCMAAYHARNGNERVACAALRLSQMEESDMHLLTDLAYQLADSHRGMGFITALETMHVAARQARRLRV